MPITAARLVQDPGMLECAAIVDRLSLQRMSAANPTIN
jgi:hypothetical protein